ncbi:MAG: ABC transporter ATP-binding protein [Acidobacteria bacterium]|nr:ABC transporter ATP-binding protein [Acidobacteriota bacterium]MCA1652231.1 ABC transporter ATP-binding protein [Acidobacteriota bacterium]
MPPAILIDELTKDYAIGFWRQRPYRALDRLSLDIESGEVFGFLGPNGAGKTTTLKLLMQLIFPTAGRAEILGRPVGDVAMRRRIGYLPENPSFYDYLTAEELMDYFGRLFGYAGADRRRRVAALLDRVGIDGASRRMQLRKFSKGMIQRVGIAQALLNDPEVVFLDEPMSGLDPIGRREVRSLILDLRDQGRTIVFSSHILADAEALCSRVAVIAGGQLAAEGRLTDILAFQIRGWELVVAELQPSALERIAPMIERSTEIAPHRYALEITLDHPPERIVTELAAAGATIVSLNPVRDTLEDFFVQQVAAVGQGARTTGAGDERRRARD